MFSPAWIPALGALLPLWPRDPERPLAFLLGWTLAALAGVVMLPNFYEHYLLPLCLPVSVLAARFLGFRLIGPAVALLSIGFMLSAGPALDFAGATPRALAMAGLVRDIAARDPHPRLLVYSGPVDLYRQFGSYPPSPLYYPTHLSFASEIDVSHLSTRTELLRILAGRPSVVLVYACPPLERIPLSGPTGARLCHAQLPQMVHPRTARGLHHPDRRRLGRLRAAPIVSPGERLLAALPLARLPIRPAH